MDSAIPVRFAALAGCGKPGMLSPVAGRPRGEHPTREQLVKAALDCFVDQGYHSTTMRQVARVADTSIAQLYLSFPSKQLLLTAAYERGVERLLTGFLRPAMALPGDGEERVDRALTAYASFFLDEPQLASLMVNTSLADLDQDDPGVQAMLQQQAATLMEVFALLGPVTDGAVIAPDHLMRWLWGGIYGIASHNMRLPHLGVDQDEYRRVVAAGLRLIFDGLARQREQQRTAAAAD